MQNQTLFVSKNITGDSNVHNALCGNRCMTQWAGLPNSNFQWICNMVARRALPSSGWISQRLSRCSTWWKMAATVGTESAAISYRSFAGKTGYVFGFPIFRLVPGEYVDGELFKLLSTNFRYVLESFQFDESLRASS